MLIQHNRSSTLIAIAGPHSLATCTAANPAPRKWRLTADELGNSPKGAWINVWSSAGRFSGELLAVNRETLVMLSRKKTTTIKVLSGLLPPSSGTVTIAGFDIVRQPIEAKAITGFIPDTPFIFDRLTGSEFLRFVGRLYGMTDVAARDGAI